MIANHISIIKGKNHFMLPYQLTREGKGEPQTALRQGALTK